MAQGKPALQLVWVAAGACASAAVGCGLFVDFEDGASAAATEGAGAASSAGAPASAAATGGAGGAGGAGGGQSSEACEVGGWQLEHLAHWPDEIVLDMVPLDGGGIALANLTAPLISSPSARDTVVRVVNSPQQSAEPFKVSIDSGEGDVRNSVALARGGKGLIVAATSASGTVRSSALRAGWHAGLVAFSVDPADWATPEVHVECDSPSLESVAVAAGDDARIALAANTFTVREMPSAPYDCGCGPEFAAADKDLLLWPDVNKISCPLRTGGIASHDASPALAFHGKGLLVSANYTADTTFLGADVIFGSATDPYEVDRFLASVAATPDLELAWATPAARTWHGGGGGTFLAAPLGEGSLIGGGLYGPLDPNYQPFSLAEPRLAALARVTAAGDVQSFTLLSEQPGLLRSLEVHPGCALIAGVLDSTDLPWMTNRRQGPTFVALIGTAGRLTPLTGVALPTQLTPDDPPSVFARRGDKDLVIAGVYRNAPILGGTKLQQANPLGTFVVRVVQP